MRYLSDNEKEGTVNFWLKTRDAQKPINDVAREHIVMGGFDWPDPPIFPYTDRINALPGICTISSCMGHQIVPGIEQYSEGYVWFRLSRPATEIFEKHAIELAREAVSLKKSYNLARATQYWEWYEVEFTGGEKTLTDYLDPIVGVLERRFTPDVHPVRERENETEPDALRSVLTANLETAGTET